jgi:hypothetical protein
MRAERGGDLMTVARHLAALLGLVLIVSAGSARADSANFYMAGTCDGQDAPQNHPIQMIEFAAVFPAGAPPVYVRGLQVRLFPADGQMLDRNSYMFAGDADQPDILAWGKQQVDGTWAIDWTAPPGMAWRWGQSHIDLHFSCYPVGVTWRAWYTVQYSYAAPAVQ